METNDTLKVLAVFFSPGSKALMQFQLEWLPVTLQSWSPMRLVYSIANYSWEKKGFNFTANYTFTTDGICGHQTLTSPDGEIESVRIVPDGQLNYYYHQKCTWLLDTKIERQLNLELYTAQNREYYSFFNARRLYSSLFPEIINLHSINRKKFLETH